MDAWIQLSNFEATDYKKIELAKVKCLYLKHDWKAELEREKELGEEGSPPGIGLTNHKKDLLHIMPLKADLSSNDVYVETNRTVLHFFKTKKHDSFEAISRDEVLAHIEQYYTSEKK
ncbi:MAG: hypothetical protein OCC49_19725 [Fibrobacterales bacterium]